MTPQSVVKPQTAKPAVVPTYAVEPKSPRFGDDVTMSAAAAAVTSSGATHFVLIEADKVVSSAEDIHGEVTFRVAHPRVGHHSYFVSLADND